MKQYYWKWKQYLAPVATGASNLSAKTWWWRCALVMNQRRMRRIIKTLYRRRKGTVNPLPPRRAVVDPIRDRFLRWSSSVQVNWPRKSTTKKSECHFLRGWFSRVPRNTHRRREERKGENATKSRTSSSKTKRQIHTLPVAFVHSSAVVSHKHSRAESSTNNERNPPKYRGKTRSCAPQRGIFWLHFSRECQKKRHKVEETRVIAVLCSFPAAPNNVFHARNVRARFFSLAFLRSRCFSSIPKQLFAKRPLVKKYLFSHVRRKTTHINQWAARHVDLECSFLVGESSTISCSVRKPKEKCISRRKCRQKRSGNLVRGKKLLERLQSRWKTGRKSFSDFGDPLLVHVKT